MKYHKLIVLLIPLLLSSCINSKKTTVYKYVSKKNDNEIFGDGLPRFFKSDSTVVRVYMIKSKDLNGQLEIVKDRITKENDTIESLNGRVFDDMWYYYAFVTPSKDTLYALPPVWTWRYKNLRGVYSDIKIKKYIP